MTVRGRRERSSPGWRSRKRGRHGCCGEVFQRPRDRSENMMFSVSVVEVVSCVLSHGCGSRNLSVRFAARHLDGSQDLFRPFYLDTPVSSAQWWDPGNEVRVLRAWIALVPHFFSLPLRPESNPQSSVGLRAQDPVDSGTPARLRPRLLFPTPFGYKEPFADSASAVSARFSRPLPCGCIEVG